MAGKKEKMTEKDGWQTSRGERMSYGLYFIGQNIFYMLVTAFAALFMMNRGLSEVAVAGILIAPKIWDAVNDPIFGIIVDKAHFRSGRFIPWLRLSWILIPAFTVLMFAMPDSLSMSGKFTWAIVSYVLWSMSYTVCDAPIFALSTSMSSVIQERTSILSFGRLCATITTVVVTLVIQAVYMSIGWLVLAVILSVIAMIMMLPILILGRERSHAHSDKAPTIKEMYKVMLRNKYLLVFIISYFFIAATMSVEILIPIFAQYVLGSTTAGTILLGLCMLPMITIAAIVPPLAKKVDKFWLFIASIGLYAVSSIFQYFTSYTNELVLYVTTFIRAIGFGGYSILLFMFIPNILEYGQYLTGERQEGIYFSLQTFMTKLTGAIVTSFTLIILGWFGFRSADADPVTGMVGVAAGQGFWTVYTLISAIGSVIAIPILVKLYKLRDTDVQLMSRYNNGELSREECDKQLSIKV